MSKRSCISTLLVFSLWLTLAAQQQPAQQPTPSPAPGQTSAAAQPGAARDQDAEVVRITTNLVQVDAVVTKDGRLVTDLKPEDFEIFEDGRPQAITNFSYISNVPGSQPHKAAPMPARDLSGPPIVPTATHPHDVRRTIALVVDDLGMSLESMGQMKSQLRKFVDEQVLPNDLVAIMRTGGEVGALQQFTTDRRLLYRAIELLRWNPCSRTGPNVFNIAGSSQGPALCSASAMAGTLQSLNFILRGMRDLPGRKSMVVLTDNLPRPLAVSGMTSTQQPDLLTAGTINATSNVGPEPTLFSSSALDRIIELAIRASVVIYAVDTRGLQYTGFTTRDRFPPGFSRQSPEITYTQLRQDRSLALVEGREGSDYLARQTGGFPIHNSNDFSLKEIIEDQQGYYLLGYQPSDETFNRKFHHIKVRVKRRGLSVRTREGFYGVTEEKNAPRDLTTRDQMNKSLMSPFGANDITVRLTTFFANNAVEGSLLRTFVYLDARDLTFSTESDGGHLATFDLSNILFGDNGGVVSQQDQTVALRLHGEAYDRAISKGAIYSFDIPVKHPGAFQLRVAVRDTISSRIGAAGQFVEIPNLHNNRLALSDIVIRGLKSLQDSGGHAPAIRQDAVTAQTEIDGDINNSPAVRRFHQGGNLAFAYVIYNAISDERSHLPNLSTRTRIFRDGKPVYTGEPTPLTAVGQSDLQRISTLSQLELGPQLTPGQYVLQILVEDHLAKEKQRTVTQWIDFEVEKD